jgi:hypothetical protein
MKYKTPNAMITDSVKRIEQFLREGMQQHAIDELESTIARINEFHQLRHIQDEISDIGEVVPPIKEIVSKYEDSQQLCSRALATLQTRRDTLFKELETMK